MTRESLSGTLVRTLTDFDHQVFVRAETVNTEVTILQTQKEQSQLDPIHTVS